jgi:hypothetical protein
LLWSDLNETKSLFITDNRASAQWIHDDDAHATLCGSIYAVFAIRKIDGRISQGNAFKIPFSDHFTDIRAWEMGRKRHMANQSLFFGLKNSVYSSVAFSPFPVIPGHQAPAVEKINNLHIQAF